MVWDDLTPARLLSRGSFANAIAVAMVMGCSTNAIIHLLAISRRARLPVTLDDFDTASRHVGVIANIRPSGERYLMEDFFYAGGLPALMKVMASKLDLSALTVTGKTVGDNIAGAEVFNDDAIRPLDKPIYAEGALAFDDYPSLKAAVDDADLDVTGDDILVLRNAGPKGAGMPEWGMLPIPTKLLKQGVTDMLRLSDARMSGTSDGGCLLHCSPEAAIGGPLALVKSGDRIRVDVPARTIHLEVSDAELAARRAAWTPPPARYERGYGWMFSRHVMQAHEGCDFDFLDTQFGAPVPEPAIY
jgi:dihydroxy-acid dehydratase